MLFILKRIARFFLDIFQTFVFALAVFVILYQVAGQPHMVNGTCMVPNFYHKEYILTEKVTYYFRKPERGDVVVFKYPKNPELHYFKRIIGLPGETIKFEGGQVFIDGKILTESYLAPGIYTEGGTVIPEGKEFKIPENHYVLMGDNRGGSSDSREWGTVERKLLIGKAFFRYWPPQRIGLIRHAEYK